MTKPEKIDLILQLIMAEIPTNIGPSEFDDEDDDHIKSGPAVKV